MQFHNLNGKYFSRTALTLFFSPPEDRKKLLLPTVLPLITHVHPHRLALFLPLFYSCCPPRVSRATGSHLRGPSCPAPSPFFLPHTQQPRHPPSTHLGGCSCQLTQSGGQGEGCPPTACLGTAQHSSTDEASQHPSDGQQKALEHDETFRWLLEERTEVMGVG